MKRHLQVLVGLLAMLAGSLWSQSVLPDGNNGLARFYPHDVGIQNSTNVIFAEKFDEASITDLAAKYEEVGQTSRMAFSTDIAPAAGDSKSLLMTHVGGQASAIYLYRRLRPGYDRWFVRYYVKFDPSCYAIHHLSPTVGGYNPSTPYPQGGAGIRPIGNDRFNTQMESGPWSWDFYSYWMGMRHGPDKDPNGNFNYWGNNFFKGVTGLAITRGQWICVEIMVKMNTPVTESNGEMACWIDGNLIRYNGQLVSYLGKGFPKGSWLWGSWSPDPAGQPFEGFQWRNDPALKLNFIKHEIYITDAPAGYVSKVWFDNVVVADQYIGPIATLSPLGIPSNVSPTQGATLRAAQTVTLQGSAFSDPDPGVSHSATEFRVRTDAGNYTTPAWTSGVLTATTSVPIQLGALPDGLNYWWQCRYRDNTSRWSDWSGETSFTMLTNHAPVASNLLVVVESGRRIPIGLPAFDPDADALTYAITANPAHGTLDTANLQNGSVDYQSAAGFNSSVSIGYSVSDGLASDSGTLTLMVSDPKKLTIGLLMDSLGRAAIQYPAMVGYIYKVQYCDGLTNQWNDLFAGTVATGTFETTADTNRPLAKARFYRVMVTLP